MGACRDQSPPFIYSKQDNTYISHSTVGILSELHRSASSEPTLATEPSRHTIGILSGPHRITLYAHLFDRVLAIFDRAQQENEISKVGLTPL